MNEAYSIVCEEGDQTGSEDSFLGGRPKLPRGVRVPQCSLCGSDQTFFLQIAFPPDHAWAEHSLAVFACTMCADENHLIPEMLSGQLPGADVSAAFLAAYQRNFRFLVLETGAGTLVAKCPVYVRFRPVRLLPSSASPLGQVGGKPAWILEDETPGSIESRPPIFLLQLGSNIAFETVDGAPRQIEIGLAGNAEPSPDACYRLFIGNATYLFGADQPGQDTVYAVTQVP